MRLIAAFLALFFVPSLALAQANGAVESIGFESSYRPDSWTPIIVRINPETAQTATYLLQIVQRDLDQDQIVYERQITLTGNSEGQANRTQRFMHYFIPKPTDGGLPTNPSELEEALQVFLTTTSGKQFTQLSMKGVTIASLDPPQQMWSPLRGNKLILTVSGDGAPRPTMGTAQQVVGVAENMVMQYVPPRKMPENILGYDAVDGVLWMNADPAELSQPTDERFRALKDYVRQGGHLVICQPASRDLLRSFGDLMPVIINEITETSDLSKLAEIVTASTIPADSAPFNAFSNARGSFRVARATTKPGARTTDWILLDRQTGDQQPYIVRMLYGLGCVTWVAQDLSDPAVNPAGTANWPLVWHHVFGWNTSAQIVFDQQGQAQMMARHNSSNAVDLGAAYLAYMDFGKKAAGLILLAIAFFIVYWLVAGPGLFTYLATKKQGHLNWFLFGAGALAATVFTVLVVKLVLRGDAETKHVTFVQIAPNTPTVMNSRIGLYIPADGSQELELTGNSPDHISYITPYSIHPDHLKSAVKAIGWSRYTVPVRDAASQAPARIEVPFRSTLKKLEARWVGASEIQISGNPKMLSNAMAGTILNATGRDLRNIYLVLPTTSAQRTQARDIVFYHPNWKKGTSLDLATAATFGNLPFLDNQVNGRAATPENGMSAMGFIGIGTIDKDWDRYWLSKFNGGEQLMFDDSQQRLHPSYPVLSLYDRIAPRINKDVNNQIRPTRFEILRRDARFLNLSHVLAAGHMLVLAESEPNAPLPFGMELNGDPISGQGQIFYQAILPVDYSAVGNGPPATQPVEAALIDPQ